MFGILREKEAEKALKKLPFFARALVRRKGEERVKNKNGSRVTLSDYREAEASKERGRSIITKIS